MKTAILFGATGLIGKHLLDLLLNNHDYTKIRIFSRNAIQNDHHKIVFYNINFNEIDKYTNDIKGDDCFFCYRYNEKINTKERRLY